MSISNWIRDQQIHQHHEASYTHGSHGFPSKSEKRHNHDHYHEDESLQHYASVSSSKRKNAWHGSVLRGQIQTISLLAKRVHEQERDSQISASHERRQQKPYSYTPDEEGLDRSKDTWMKIFHASKADQSVKTSLGDTHLMALAYDCDYVGMKILPKYRRSTLQLCAKAVVQVKNQMPVDSGKMILEYCGTYNAYKKMFDESNRGETALSVALKNNNKAIIKLLLDADSNPNLPLPYPAATSTPAIMTLLKNAARKKQHKYRRRSHRVQRINAATSAE